jgi:hypothetical protein
MKMFLYQQYAKKEFIFQEFGGIDQDGGLNVGESLFRKHFFPGFQINCRLLGLIIEGNPATAPARQKPKVLNFLLRNKVSTIVTIMDP